MESARDPELGQENLTKDVPKSQRPGFQSSATLNEPLLPSQAPPTSKDSGYSFTHHDGTVYTIPSYVGERVPKDLYVQLSSDPPHALEFTAEVGRLLSRLCLNRERISADNEIRRRMGRSISVITAYHSAFMITTWVAVYGGYVDGKLWSVAFSLMLVELVVLIIVLALKMVQMYQYDNRKQPEKLNLKLNFQNMPALRAHLGEQEFKDFTEPWQKLFDRTYETFVAEPVERSFSDTVKSYFKRRRQR